jgi:hypothetical protein
LEVIVAARKLTEEMLLMVDEQVSISVPSDHCEYIEIDSLEPTVGGISTLAMLMEKLVEMEPEDRLDIVMTCEVGDEE